MAQVTLLVRPTFLHTPAGSTLSGHKTIRSCMSAVGSGKGVDFFSSFSQVKVDLAGRMTLFSENFSF